MCAEGRLGRIDSPVADDAGGELPDGSPSVVVGLRGEDLPGRDVHGGCIVNLTVDAC